MRGRQKSLTGTVVSDKMDKTVIVVVETTTRHRLYHKIMKRSKRYLAHDDHLEAKPGDLVRIMETRPMSRHKRWRVAEIIERGEVPEIAPREIDSEYIELHREREAPPAPRAAEAPETAAHEADAETALAEAPEAEAQAAAEAGPAVEETAATDEQAAPEAEAALAEEPAVGDEPAPEEPAEAQEATEEQEEA